MSLHLYFFRGKGIRLFLFQVTSGVSFLKQICRLSPLTVRWLVSQSWDQVLVLFFFGWNSTRWCALLQISLISQVMCMNSGVRCWVLFFVPAAQDMRWVWSGLGCLCRFCARHFPPVCCGRMKEDLFMLSFHCGRCFTAYYCFPARS